MTRWGAATRIRPRGCAGKLRRRYGRSRPRRASPGIRFFANSDAARRGPLRSGRPFPKGFSAARTCTGSERGGEAPRHVIVAVRTRRKECAASGEEPRAMKKRRDAMRLSPSEMRALPLLLAAALQAATAGAGAQERRTPAPYFPAPEAELSERAKERLIDAAVERIQSGRPLPRGNAPPQPAPWDPRAGAAPGPAPREMCEAFFERLWCTNFETGMTRGVSHCGQCR